MWPPYKRVTFQIQPKWHFDEFHFVLNFKRNPLSLKVISRFIEMFEFLPLGCEWGGLIKVDRRNIWYWRLICGAWKLVLYKCGVWKLVYTQVVVVFLAKLYWSYVFSFEYLRNELIKKWFALLKLIHFANRWFDWQTKNESYEGKIYLTITFYVFE